MTYFEQEEKVITQVLDKIQVGEQWQHKFTCFGTEWYFGLRQPGPMVRVRTPRVGVLEWEGQPIVYGCYYYLRSSSPILYKIYLKFFP